MLCMYIMLKYIHIPQQCLNLIIAINNLRMGSITAKVYLKKNTLIIMNYFKHKKHKNVKNFYL